MTISEAFSKISDAKALEHLEKYYLGDRYTGASFDTFGRNEPNEVTADDLIAVACLSIHVPAPAALAILGSHAAQVSNFLAQIPVHISLDELSLDRHEETFGEKTPALELWNLLRAKGDKPWGIGPTTASKIMARKRPALIPIYDSVVAKVAGLDHSGGTWLAWHETFSTDQDLVKRLRGLRQQAEREDLSLLRVLDVVLWMSGKGTNLPERVDHA